MTRKYKRRYHSLRLFNSLSQRTFAENLELQLFSNFNREYWKLGTVGKSTGEEKTGIEPKEDQK